METQVVKAILKHYRMSPRRVREVADIIRGKRAEDAQNILDFTNRRAAAALKKLLNSAIANASNNFSMDPDKLFVNSIFVDEGPMWKRFVTKSHGRASRIVKRTSHVTIILGEQQVA
jgi:large subunit ribosomal protein L22